MGKAREEALALLLLASACKATTPGPVVAPPSPPVRAAEPDPGPPGVEPAPPQCAPEDLDGFEDHDGCEDPDNDQDGLLDRDDQCPNQPETYPGSADMPGPDGVAIDDADGCPD